MVALVLVVALVVNVVLSWRAPMDAQTFSVFVAGFAACGLLAALWDSAVA